MNKLQQTIVSVVVPIGMIGGAFALRHQQAKESFLQPLLQPCSPEQQEKLTRADTIIIQNRERIRTWYKRLCDFKKVVPDEIPDSIFESYENGKLERFCAKDQAGVIAVLWLIQIPSASISHR